MDNTISTLDQCTANAKNVKSLYLPETIRERLALTRANMLNDVNEFFEIDNTPGIVDNLLMPFDCLLSVCSAVERDYNETGVESKAHNHLPTFLMLEASFHYLVETIKFVGCMGDNQDLINRLQACLCVQQEPEGHTITGK